MSLAEYASKPFPVFTKLAVRLRNLRAMQFVITKFAALLRGARTSREPLDRKALDDARSVPRYCADQPVAILESIGDIAIAAPKPNDEQSEREKLIRKRWVETGIKMWNPNVHGTGHAALNIQGRVELLPPSPGGTLPRYDKLSFDLIGSQIVCEGIVVDPPKGRRRF
jgi:hypothetical protein